MPDNEGKIVRQSEIDVEEEAEPEIALTPEQKYNIKKINYALIDNNFDLAVLRKNESNLSDKMFQQIVKDAFIDRIERCHIDDALKIKDLFNLPEAIMTSPEVQQAAKDSLIFAIRNGRLNEALEIKTKLNLPESVVQQAAKYGLIYQLEHERMGTFLEIKTKFNLPESVVQQTIKDILIDILKWGHTDDFLEIKTKFNLPESVVQQAAKDGLIYQLEHERMDTFLEIKTKFNLPESVVQQAAKDGLMNKIRNGRLDEALKIKDSFNLPESIMASPEVQQAAKDGFIDKVRDGRLDRALEIKDSFNLPESIMASPEVQQAFKNIIIHQLKNGRLDEALKIKDSFNLSESVTNSPEVQQVAKDGLISKIKNGWLNEAAIIKNQFNLPESIMASPEVQQAAKDKLISTIRSRRLDEALKIKDSFKLPDSVINSPEVQQAAKDFFIFDIKNGRLDEALKIKDSFNLSESVVQQAVKDGLIYKLKSGNIDDFLEIKTKFNLPESIMASPEVQQAAKDGLMNKFRNGRLNEALKIKDSFNLSESVINSPEVQQAAKDGLINQLENGRVGVSLEIKDSFNLPEAVVKSALNQMNDTKLRYSYGIKLGLGPAELELMWSELLKEIENEPFMADKFALAGSLWGQAKWESLIKNNAVFWENPHDNLLFLDRIVATEIERPEPFNPAFPANFEFDAENSTEFIMPVKQNELFNIVLKPIIGRDFENFSRLNELLGYFDLEKYREKSAGKPAVFTNFEMFAREAELQRYDINIPTGASEEFKQAIMHFMPIKGVNVSFLRQMVEVYANHPIENDANYLKNINHYDEDDEEDEEVDNLEEDDEDNEEYDEFEDFNADFAQRLINIIEGLEPINDNKEIKPWSETMSLDPIHRLVFTAVGIHSLNNLTIKMQEHLDKGGAIDGLIDLFSLTNKEIISQIEQTYAEKIKAEPQKKNRLKAECDRQIKKDQLLVFGGKQEIYGISGFNEDSWNLVLHTESDQLAGQLAKALNEPGLRELIYSALTDLSKKSEIIDNCVDLINFRDALLDIAVKISQEFDREAFQAAPTADIMALFEGKTAALSAYLLYLSINNRKRQIDSKKFKSSVDQIINQERYKKQLAELKEKGIIQPKTDIFSAYTQGKIRLENIDDEQIRKILESFGYNNLGRSLKAEIATGDDYTAWTCGDQTDCCMPLTSDKNQEYLLRNDTAYFVVKIINQSCEEEIIAQSVLVHGENPKNKEQEVIALDNIEIANRAINLRPAIKEAYLKLKEELISRFAGKPLRIIIGTSYNDDGGTITGEIPLLPLEAQPRQGKLRYSDCFSHSSAYEFFNSNEAQAEIKYFGLAKDSMEKSRIFELIKNKEELSEIEALVAKIGQGEDDGGGGLNFPDNYSNLIIDVVAGDQAVGYVVAADYLDDNEDSDDYCYIEKIGWQANVGLKAAQDYFKSYLESRDLITGKSHEDLDGLKISQSVIEDQPTVLNWLEQIYGPDQIKKLANGDLSIEWPQA